MRSFRPGFRSHGSLDTKTCSTIAQHVHGLSSHKKIFTNTLQTNTTFSQHTFFQLRLPLRYFATQKHPVAPPKKKTKRPSNLTPIGVDEFIKEVNRLKTLQEDSTLTDEQKAEQIFTAIKRTLPFYDVSSEEETRQQFLELQILLSRGRLSEALSCANKMLSRNIANMKIRADVFTKKAQIHFTMQQYKQGLDSAEEALSIEPASFDARICKALCVLGEKNTEAAMNQIDSVIAELEEQVDPRREHLAIAFNAKGTVYYALGEPAQARYWMQKGLQYNPDGSLQHIMLRGVELMERGQYQRALQIFEEDLQKLEESAAEIAVPARPKLLLLKSKCLIHLNRFNDAIACLDDMSRSPTLFPMDRGYMTAEKSRALLGLGKPTEAMKLVQDALEANPEIGRILLEEQIITSLPEGTRQVQFSDRKALFDQKRKQKPQSIFKPVQSKSNDPPEEESIVEP